MALFSVVMLSNNTFTKELPDEHLRCIFLGNDAFSSRNFTGSGYEIMSMVVDLVLTGVFALSHISSSESLVELRSLLGSLQYHPYFVLFFHRN